MIEAAMIWNEPNNKSHWDPEIDPEWSLYADMVIRAGQASFGLAPPRIRDHPRLQGLELPPLGGNRDLLLVTKTLLFSGQQQPNAEGSYLLTARDKTTGDVLAEIPLPGRAIGAPMSYLIDDRQYIAVTVQGDTPQLVALTVEN